jgi:glutathione S-transferase
MSSDFTSKDVIVLYDIGHRPPVQGSNFAPNPWKSRLALNFKGVPYTTNWVRLPDVSKVRRGLGQAAGRKFADGTDFFTLPVMHDPATGSTIGDSFDIAVYLQRRYPDAGGDLLPAQDLDFTFTPPFAFPTPLSEPDDGGFPEYLRFNINVDAAFSTHTQLMIGGMPFDPATIEETKVEWTRRAGISNFDDMILTGEGRVKTMESFKAMLGDLSKLFVKNPDGPFLLGKQVSYADFIVGAWLRMSQICLPKAEWEEVKGCHGRVFGRLHDALDVYAEVK